MSLINEGPLPQINGNGEAEYTVKLYNRQYWEIRNLDITNYGSGESKRIGVYIKAEDFGTVNHIYLTNLVIHDVNGDLTDKNNGGIVFRIFGSITKTYFNDILIEGCHIYDVDRTGMSNQSTWRIKNVGDNWVPSTNFVVRNNFIERTGCNGLIVRVAEAPLIEHNTFRECAIKGNGNACFAFNCNDAVFQYNEVAFTEYNPGDNDAGGIDSDYQSKNTLIQYNYVHHNEYGGIVAVCDGEKTDSFNIGTVIRYNILENNEDHAIRVSGCTTNTTIYNNTIFGSATKVVWHKSYGGCYPDSTSYYNNIFYTLNPNASYDLGKSSNSLFDNNLYYGTAPNNLPPDEHNIVADPLLVNPGGGVNGYQLQEASPAIDSGKIIPEAECDYFGNPVPINLSPDIGVHEFGAQPKLGDVSGNWLIATLAGILHQPLSSR